jgi:DNA repair protein RadD
MDKPKITGSAITEYLKAAKGKRAVVFCVSISHSEHVVEQFNAHGIPAEHVDGKTPKQQRDAAIKRFQSGETLVLSNVELFGEGFDLPAIECAILLRPTQSLGLHLQQVGRALRPSPGKTHAIILDHVENYKRHGLPDTERSWSLHGQPPRSRSKNDDNVHPIKTCDKCFAAQPVGSTICKNCGQMFATSAREVEEVDGELQELDQKYIALKRKREQAKASSLEDLIELAVSRNYKHPHRWAKHVFNARQAKKLKRGRSGSR